MLTFSVSWLDSKARLRQDSPPQICHTLEKLFASPCVMTGWSVLLQRNRQLEPACRTNAGTCHLAWTTPG